MTRAELDRMAMREAVAMVTRYRATWPLFSELTGEIHRLMTRHRWMTLAQAYEVAGMAHVEAQDE